MKKKTRTYKYKVKKEDLYLNINIGDEDIIYWIKDIIQLKKDDLVELIIHSRS